MKKIIVLLITITLSINIFAQSSEVYVIFTKTSKGKGAEFKHLIDEKTNLSIFRYPSHYFLITGGKVGYNFSFSYSCRRTEPDNPILTKPTSFLNTVTYIDWDIVCPTLNTFEKAKAKVDQIKSYSKIYFIDRTEIVNGTMKIVPVKAVEHLY